MLPAMNDQQLSPAERDELRKLHEAATPGPWNNSQWTSPSSNCVVAQIPCSRPIYAAGDRGIFSFADSCLIAEARNALPKLLDDLDHAYQDVNYWKKCYKKVLDECSFVESELVKAQVQLEREQKKNANPFQPYVAELAALADLSKISAVLKTPIVTAVQQKAPPSDAAKWELVAQLVETVRSLQQEIYGDGDEARPNILGIADRLRKS